jgi:hypothetical protein
MKKRYYIPLAILLLLIITNPGIKSFKDYTGVNTFSGLRRTSNFFVCSIYDDGDRYFAIAGNFFKINPPLQEVNPFEDQSENDTTRMRDTSLMPAAFIPDTSSDKYKRFYNNLIKLGYTEKNLGIFQNFKEKVSIKKYAVKLYRALLKSGFTINQIGREEDFTNTFCVK